MSLARSLTQTVPCCCRRPACFPIGRHCEGEGAPYKVDRLVPAPALLEIRVAEAVDVSRARAAYRPWGLEESAA